MRYVRWAGSVLWFPFYFALEVLKANLSVGHDVLTPGSNMSAGFVEVPLRCRSRLEITTLANMITLTPGTVTVAIHEDPATLWVHGLYLESPEAFRREIRAMEDRLLAATRIDGAPHHLPPLGSWSRGTGS